MSVIPSHRKSDPHPQHAEGGDRGGDPHVLEEYHQFPDATWVPRVRHLSIAPFNWVSGRIRRGLRFGVAVRIDDEVAVRPHLGPADDDPKGR